jgi:hypothetical protein
MTSERRQLVKAWQVPNLTPAVRLVLLDLADCADHEGRNAFRSEQTIADWSRSASAPSSGPWPSY